MLKYFKYRLNPNKEESILLNKHIGASRFIYNLALETKQMAWAGSRANLDCFDLIKQLPDLKNECPWLKEINSQSLQAPIRNLDNAFTRFFKGQGNFPNFKKKSGKGSFNIPQKVSIENGRLFIPKFKTGIKIVLHRANKGEIRQATVIRTPTGKYFVSVLCETNEPLPIKPSVSENTTIGVDLGIKTYIVCSDGREVNSPKFLRKSESKLKYLQKRFSKSKGKRTKQKLVTLHEKIANQRKDFLDKLSTKLIKSHDSIAIENLAISNMVKNHSIAKSINDAGWGMFVNMLEYKAEWYGKNILKIGRFEPSSKLHNTCGHINKNLTLSDREWVCPKCGETVSRDLNAAINIKNFALRNHLSGEHRLKNQNELPTLVGVLTSETATI